MGQGEAKLRQAEKRFEEEVQKRRDLEEMMRKIETKLVLNDFEKSKYKEILREEKEQREQEKRVHQQVMERAQKAREEKAKQEYKNSTEQISNLSEQVKDIEKLLSLMTEKDAEKESEKATLLKLIEEMKTNEKKRDEEIQALRKKEEEEKKRREREAEEREKAEKKKKEEEEKRQKSVPASASKAGRGVPQGPVKQPAYQPKKNTEEQKRPHRRDAGKVWTEEEKDKLREKILKKRLDPDGKPVAPHILVFGPTGHGKSTLCNGLLAALDDERYVPQKFVVGTTKKSFTKNFQSRSTEGIHIVDMCGIVQDKAVDVKNLKKILNGEVSLSATISEAFVATGGIDKPFDFPMVLIVLRHTELDEKLKEELSVVNELAGHGILSRHLVITHMDIEEPALKDPENLTKLYSYDKVTKALRDMSEQTGIPLNNIHVLRNYVEETETDLHTKLLHLRFLDMVMSHVQGQIDITRERKSKQ